MVLVSENGKNMDPPDLPHRFLVAIGGNAIHPAGIKGTAEEQVAIAHATGRALLPLMELENNLVITHGNGPVLRKNRIRHKMNSLARSIYRVSAWHDVCHAHSHGIFLHLHRSHGLDRKNRRSCSGDGTAQFRRLPLLHGSLSQIPFPMVVLLARGSAASSLSSFVSSPRRWRSRAIPWPLAELSVFRPRTGASAAPSPTTELVWLFLLFRRDGAHLLTMTLGVETGAPMRKTRRAYSCRIGLICN